MYKLLGVNTDAKTKKGVKYGYLTGVMYLAPHTLAGGRSVCPFSTAGCRAVCLYSAGRGAFTNVQQARIRKTQWWLRDPVGFKAQIVADVTRLVAEAKKKGLKPVVRLNGTSDICWEKEGLMEQFPAVQWMDYTKLPPTMRKNLPPNYSLTFSFSEAKHASEWAQGWLERGSNAAVVFNGKLPDTFLGRPVVDGDLSDLRFMDPRGVIVGLKTKGYARSAEVGPGHFVQQGRAA